MKIRALLQKHISPNNVKCLTCHHRCVINEGKTGKCRTRLNSSGELWTLTYGVISSMSINPIEKKPLFHFHPGSQALTIGSYSCNFSCPWCQNWEISKEVPKNATSRLDFQADQIAKRVNENSDIHGVSISFNEPTLSLEYSLDIFSLIDSRRKYKSFVTNGYMTHEALDLLIKNGLNAMSITVKGNRETVKKYCDANVDHVWEIIRHAYEEKIHVELVYLIVTEASDDPESIISFIDRVKEIDTEIPVHFTAYHPSYDWYAERTPLKVIDNAICMAARKGLRWVYVGNVQNHIRENTWCPTCNALIIRRNNIFEGIKNLKLSLTNECTNCGEKIPIVGQLIT